MSGEISGISKIVNRGLDTFKHMMDARPHVEHHQEHTQTPTHKGNAHADQHLRKQGTLPNLSLEDHTTLSDEARGVHKQAQKPQHNAHNESHQQEHKGSHKSATKGTEAQKPQASSNESRTGKNPAGSEVKSEPTPKHAETKPVAEAPAKPIRNVEPVREPLSPDQFLKRIEELGVKVERAIQAPANLTEHMPPNPAKGEYVKLRNQDTAMAGRQKRGGGQNHAPADTHAPTEPAAEPMTVRSFVGSTVNAGFGVLSMVSGFYEAKDGVQLIKQGHTAEGALKTVGGGADITAGGASVLFSIGHKALGTIAAKVGGGAAIITGAAETMQGIRENDDEKKLEGGIKIGCGAAMLAPHPVAAGIGTAALGGWSAGRFAGTHIRIGGQTLDSHVTNISDAVGNFSTNKEYASLQAKNLQKFSEQADCLDKSADELKAQGKNIKDVTDAIIGVREQMEASREKGQDTSTQQSQLMRLLQARGQMS